MTALVTLITSWAAQESSHVKPFSHEPHAMMEIKTPYDKAALFIDETANDATPYPVSGAVTSVDTAVTSTHDADSREVRMTAPVDSTLVNEGGRIVRQSKRYAACPADKYIVAFVSGSLLDASVIGGVDYVTNRANAATMDPSRGACYRIGVFDDGGDATSNPGDCGNGLFVEYRYDPDRDDYLAGGSEENYYAVNKLATLSGGAASSFIADYVATKLWVVFRTNISGLQRDIRIPRFEWNKDQLDIENYGSLMDIDPTRTNTYAFRWSAMPGSRSQVGVWYNGDVIWMHEFDSLEPAAGTRYRLGTATLPVRWELDNRRGASQVDMMQGRAVVSCDGEYDARGRPFSFDSHLALTTLTSQVPVPLMSIRLNDIRNRGRIHPQRFQIMNISSSGTLKYELRLNAALTGSDYTSGESYSFDNAGGTGALSLSGSGSFAQIDTAATAVSGGLTLISGYLHDNVSQDVSIDFRDIQLLANIAGEADELTVVGTYIQGASIVAVSLQWHEYD